MHDEIRTELEGYLSGDGVSRSFTQHLNDCPPCARELEEMKEISLSFQSLRFEEESAEVEALAPTPGFYLKVAGAIEAEQRSPLWGLFAPDLQFFRRVAFASLMLLAVLGSYLISRESDYATTSGPEQAILTEHNGTVVHDGAQGAVDQQHILVTLASYEH